jgi:hypothetical protein
VIASDGAIPALEQGQGNPAAASVDLNYRGGGSTKGLDERVRSYRIVRLKDPDLTGGYMLVQDYAVGVRLTTGSAPAGAGITTEWEVIDERTGKRITDPNVLNGMQVEMTVDGRTERAAVSAGGTARITQKFPQVGRTVVTGRVSNSILDRVFMSEISVVEPGFRLKLESPARAAVGLPQRIRVAAESNVPDGAGLKPLQQVTAIFSDGASLKLRSMGGGRFEADWTPARTGALNVRMLGTGGAKCEPLDVRMEVLGRIEAGLMTPVRVGPVKSQSTAESYLDLTNAKVYGDVAVQLTTDFAQRRAELEVETLSGWKAFPADLTISESGPRRWRVRLRTGECPGACEFSDARQITLEVPKPDGVDRLVVPLQVEITGDPFYVCWWREIVGSLAALVGAIIAYGFIYPFRFPSHAGLQISPEENLAEGFYYPLKRQPAARIGFYRHARIFLTDDYRIAAKPGGAFARLRAEHGNVQIRPENGRAVWKQRFDGDWEAIGSDETVVRPGTVYRNEEKTVFFEVRLK